MAGNGSFAQATLQSAATAQPPPGIAGATQRASTSHFKPVGQTRKQAVPSAQRLPVSQGEPAPSTSTVFGAGSQRFSK